MSFSADWLALRADADRRARNPDLASALAENLLDKGHLQVLDLGSGTGANLLALSPILGPRQYWVLADNDQSLLNSVAPPDGVTVERRHVDLSEDLTALFTPKPELVTASAFFDLSGADAADRIVDATVAAGATFYTVLTYDGRQDWAPPHPIDRAMLAAFNAHQRGEKGLGPALGPDATHHLAERFRNAGYTVLTASSDWVLSITEDGALISELARGSADALAPALGVEAATAWHAARHAAESVMIGHQDLLALPLT